MKPSTWLQFTRLRKKRGTTSDEVLRYLMAVEGEQKQKAVRIGSQEAQ